MICSSWHERRTLVAAWLVSAHLTRFNFANLLGPLAVELLMTSCQLDFEQDGSQAGSADNSRNG